MARDYSTHGNKDTIEVIVRPNCRFGEARAGEAVIVDRREMSIGGIAETLCTLKEWRAMEAARKKAEAAARTPPPSRTDELRDRIKRQIDEATSAAAKRRGNRIADRRAE